MPKSVWTFDGDRVLYDPLIGKVLVCDECPCVPEEEPEKIPCRHGNGEQAWKFYEVLFNNLQNHNCSDCADFDNVKFVLPPVNPACFPTPPAGGEDLQCQWRLTGLQNPPWTLTPWVDNPDACPFPSPGQSDVGFPWPCHNDDSYGRIDFQVFNDTGVIVFRVRFFGAQQSGGGGVIDVRDFNGFATGPRDMLFDEYQMVIETFSNSNNTCRRKFTDPQTEVILRKTNITIPGMYDR